MHECRVQYSCNHASNSAMAKSPTISPIPASQHPNTFNHLPNFLNPSIPFITSSNGGNSPGTRPPHLMRVQPRRPLPCAISYSTKPTTKNVTAEIPTSNSSRSTALVGNKIFPVPYIRSHCKIIFPKPFYK